MTVTITEDILKKIKYLNEKFPRIEWVAALFYIIDVSKEKEIIDILEIYPLSLGESASVETKNTIEFEAMKYFISKVKPKYPNLDIYLGRIHSHNVMDVFHSAVDEKDFEEYASGDIALSIVTNNKLEFYGKIGLPMEHPITKQRVIYKEELDFSIIEEETDDKEFKDRVEEINKRHIEESKKAKTKYNKYYSKAYNKYSKDKNYSYYDYYYDPYDDWYNKYTNAPATTTNKRKSGETLLDILEKHKLLFELFTEEITYNSLNEILEGLGYGTLSINEYNTHYYTIRKYAEYNEVIENALDEILFTDFANDADGLFKKILSKTNTTYSANVEFRDYLKKYIEKKLIKNN